MFHPLHAQQAPQSLPEPSAVESMSALASPSQSPPAAPPALHGEAVVHVVVGRRDRAQMAQIRDGVGTHPALARRQLVWHVPQRAADTPAVAERAAAAACAQAGAPGLVLAVGGDGTINAVANACLRHGVPMGVVCQGTFNFFSREQGVSPELDGAIEQFTQALEQGIVRPVYPGQVNGQAFLVNASLGLYPRLLADREAASRQFGRHRVVALVAGLLSLLRAQRGQVLRLRERDRFGRERQRMTLASTLFVGNNALQLQRVGVDDAEKAGQRHLVATTLAPCRPLTTLGLLWQALRGRLGQHAAVDSFGCTALTVEAAGWRLSRRVRVAFDGERSWMALPLRFTVSDRPLWLVAPPPRLGEGPAVAPARLAASLPVRPRSGGSGPVGQVVARPAGAEV